MIKEGNSFYGSAGETTKTPEFQTSQEIPQSELIDNYLSFDKALFISRYSLSSAEQKVRVEEAAAKYIKILNNDNIRQVFKNQASVNILSEEIIQDLRELIKEEALPGGMMLKNDKMRSSLTPLWKAAQVADPDDERAVYFASRTRNHLFRLLFPEIYFDDNSNEKYLSGRQNTVCPAFAKNFIQAIMTIPNPSLPEAMSFNRSIGAEGRGTSLFWTIAPYLDDELKRDGRSAESAMKEILDWVRASGEQRKKTEGQNFKEIWEYDSIDYIDRGVFKTHRLDFYLGFDERMPSHFLARLYAKSIIEQMNKKPR